MNPLIWLKLKKISNEFSNMHPKFADFMKKNYIENLKEGTIIKVTIQTNDGKTESSAMRVKKSDLRLVEEIKKL